MAARRGIHQDYHVEKYRYKDEEIKIQVYFTSPTDLQHDVLFGC